MRGVLDGHIVLSRELAARQQFPAIDVPASVSRLITQLTTPHQRRLVAAFIGCLADYARAEDLINIGAYTRGNNPNVDKAVDRITALRAYLQQGVDRPCRMAESFEQLQRIFPEITPAEGE
jgi:flagellum-specific ATP synthase